MDAWVESQDQTVRETITVKERSDHVTAKKSKI